MNEDRKSKKPWPVLIGILFIAYFLLAARPLEREYSWLPEWSAKIDSAIAPLPALSPALSKDGAKDDAGNADKPDRGVHEGDFAYSFRLADRFGYHDGKGKISSVAFPRGGFSVSDAAYALPGWPGKEALALQAARADRDGKVVQAESKERPEGPATTFYSPEGLILFSVRGEGFPSQLGGRFFIVGPEQTSIAEYDSGGTFLWSAEFASVVTCIDATDTLVAIGCLDGRVIAFGKDRSRIMDRKAGGSRLEIVLGLSVSPDGDSIAIVSGIDKQRFVLFSVKGGQARVVKHRYLDSDFRRPVIVRFSKDGASVFFESVGGLSSFDTRNGKLSTLPLPGRLIDIGSSGFEGVHAVICRSTDGAKLVAFRAPAIQLFETPLPGKDFFLAQEGDMVFASDGSRLFGLRIKGE